LVEQKSEARWDAIAVIDELTLEDPKCQNSVPMNQNLWGSSVFLDKNIGKTHYLETTATSRIPKLRKSQISMIKRNFFVAEIARTARYALPAVKYMIDNRRLNPVTIERSMGIKLT
jgi:ABC-type amino acid transport substrate-binding protein